MVCHLGVHSSLLTRSRIIANSNSIDDLGMMTVIPAHIVGKY